MRVGDPDIRCNGLGNLSRNALKPLHRVIEAQKSNSVTHRSVTNILRSHCSGEILDESSNFITNPLLI
jgi:hypothetical protein